MYNDIGSNIRKHRRERERLHWKIRMCKEDIMRNKSEGNGSKKV